MPQLHSCLILYVLKSYDYYSCMNEHFNAQSVLLVPYLAHYETV